MPRLKFISELIYTRIIRLSSKYYDVITSSISFRIWVNIKRQRARVLINTGVIKIFILLKFTRKIECKRIQKKKLYLLKIFDKTPSTYNNGIINKEIYELTLKIKLYIKILIFNIIEIFNSDVILGFPWLERINILLYYARRQLILPGIKELI